MLVNGNSTFLVSIYAAHLKIMILSKKPIWRLFQGDDGDLLDVGFLSFNHEMQALK